METPSHDPVCHDTNHPTFDYARAEFEGRVYYFCGTNCRDAFQCDPDAVLAAERRCQANGGTGSRREAADEPVSMVEIALHPDRHELARWVGLLRQLGIPSMVQTSPANMTVHPNHWTLRTPWALVVPRSRARDGQAELRRRELLLD